MGAQLGEADDVPAVEVEHMDPVGRPITDRDLHGPVRAVDEASAPRAHEQRFADNGGGQGTTAKQLRGSGARVRDHDQLCLAGSGHIDACGERERRQACGSDGVPSV